MTNEASRYFARGLFSPVERPLLPIKSAAPILPFGIVAASVGTSAIAYSPVIQPKTSLSRSSPRFSCSAVRAAANAWLAWGSASARMLAVLQTRSSPRPPAKAIVSAGKRATISPVATGKGSGNSGATAIARRRSPSASAATPTAIASSRRGDRASLLASRLGYRFRRRGQRRGRQ